MPIGTDPKLSNIWPYPLMGKTTIQPRTSPKQRSLLLFLFAPPKVAGTATSRDRLLQQGSGADRAHVLRRPR